MDDFGRLGDSGDLRLIEPLIARLADGMFDVHRAAAGALLSIGRSNREALRDRVAQIALLVRERHNDSPHRERYSSSDCNSHSDMHSDRGIGMDWPDF